MPEYNRIELRRAKTIAELATAKAVDVWHKPVGDHGPNRHHARTCTEIVGDPFWNPDRHTHVKPPRWDDDGMPLFGKPSLA